MNYTFFAIGCYIFMRAFKQIFEEYKDKLWYRIVYKVIAVGTLYAAFASIIVWYFQIEILGFSLK